MCFIFISQFTAHSLVSFLYLSDVKWSLNGFIVMMLLWITWLFIFYTNRDSFKSLLLFDDDDKIL